MKSDPLDQAARQISKARANLILTAPFWATIALRMDPKAAPVKTMATDGKRLYYNPSWVMAQDFEELVAVVAHEAAHIALCHHLRRGDRNHDLAQKAADYAVNPLLVDQFKLPAAALIRDDLTKLGSFEAIYAQLEREQPPPQPEGGLNPDEPQPGQDAGGAGDGQMGPEAAGEAEANSSGGAEPPPGTDPLPPTAGDVGGCGEFVDATNDDGSPLTEEQRNEADAEMRVAIAQALSVAKAAGNLPGNIETLVKTSMAPKLDWRTLTRRYVQAVRNDDYSWRKPSRRFLGRGLYLPSLYNPSVGEVVLAIDTSGSTIPDLEVFGAEFNAIIEELRPPKLSVVYIDAAIQRIDEFTADEYPVDFRPIGGGGTMFSPFFWWLNQKEDAPACCIFLTDLEVNDFGDPPPCPVLWVTTGRDRAPWGEVVRLS